MEIVNILNKRRTALYPSITTHMAGVTGIEPALAVLETDALPLNYTPRAELNYTNLTLS